MNPAQNGSSTEEWRQVVGHPGYEVSSLGRVRSVDREIIGKQGVRRLRGKLMALKTQSCGYVQLELGRGVRRYVHNLVLEAFVGPRPPGLVAAHGSGVRTDNQLGNLRWATRADNEADKLAHGTHQLGERNPYAKLTTADVQDIRSIGRSMLQREIAEIYGVTRGHVGQIIRNETRVAE